MYASPPIVDSGKKQQKLHLNNCTFSSMDTNNRCRWCI